ncbi:non-hemolytic phospholipase C precursor [Gautieria morchelliformis]|nr:non-hemolytic phospholipase C precursor [Gautieria morchelliformis]
MPSVHLRPGTMASLLKLCASVLALASSELVLKVSAQTGTIQDVEHVVLFMQENRAFDHYFGTMAGVRGFADPNVHIAQNGNPVWFQKVDGSLSNKTTALLPFYINAAGGNLSEATQCMVAGSNGWTANHNAFANGDNNLWALDNTPFSLGYYKRQDLLTHFGIAEGWTIADMYAQSVVASTDPNRVFWASGSINVPGGPQTLDQGGVTVDNNETPGCDAPDISCFPMKWKTFAEFLEDANVTWQVSQGTDNFDDNPLAWFEQFQTAPKGSALAQKGMSFLGLDAFYDAAAKGVLPQVSYIIGPAELSEHPPFAPHDGAWLQQQVVNAVIKSPKYSSTVLMISYDETGGWADHVLPIFSPTGTPGEWLSTDPFNPGPTLVPVFSGPGFRLPFYVISPWTRGGHVFTAHSDHSSQIMFLEQWLASKGKNVVTNQLNSWRRQHMSDLTQMFDFAHPDLSLPDLPVPTPPKTNAQGQFVGTAECQAMFPDPEPPIPFGEQTRQTSLIIENGFKSVRGALTEGRYLVFESNGDALAFDDQSRGLGVAPAVPSHDAPTHRFILHATAPPPATTFNIQFAGSPSTAFLDQNNKEATLINNAAVFNITDLGSGKGYTVQQVPSGKFISFSENKASVLLGDHQQTFNVFSVTTSADSGQGFLD